MSDATSTVVIVSGSLTLVFLLIVGRIVRFVAREDVDISLKGLGITLVIKRNSTKRRRPSARPVPNGSRVGNDQLS